MPRVFAIVTVLVASYNVMTTLAKAETGCTIVQALGGSTPVLLQGDMCERAFAPASTFKLVLALIGFEEGILHSPDGPIVDYDPSLNAPYESWRQATTPRRWLEFSVVWYSHRLTRQLGITEFQKHVDAIGYGNRDLSGTPGKDDGLTRAWLSTSLKITPVQQSKFLQRLLQGDLPFSEFAIDQTIAAAQRFEAAGGTRLKGKTGNAWATDVEGNRLDEQHGWFIVWLEHRGVEYTFVHLIIENKSGNGFASSRARQQVLASVSLWGFTE